MERFIEILKRLLLATNWICFGGAAIILFFVAVTKNFEIFLMVLGGGSLVAAGALTFIINWIFKAR